MDRRVESCLRQARTLGREGKRDEAIGLENEGLRLARALPQPAVEVAAVHGAIAERLVRERDLANADAAFAAAIEAYRLVPGHQREIFDMQLRRGVLAQVAGAAGPARAHLDSARDLARKHFPALEARVEQARASVKAAATGAPMPPKPRPPRPQAPAQRPPLEPILAELDALVGLDAVKTQVRTYVNFLQVQGWRHEAGHRQADVSHHLAFEGPPGTGKTTVARIFGRLLFALGVLDTDKLVEVSRAQLVAGYVGQTASLVDAAVDRALDGVLFVDEAYALAPGGDGQDFGAEAIAQLIVRMENDRDRLAVILAGYTDKMEAFIASNPGLESRISERIRFADYGPEELAAIFTRFAEADEYRLGADSAATLLEICTTLHARRTERFGNARTIRNLFEDTIGAHANRLVAEGREEPDALIVLTPADLTAAAG